MTEAKHITAADAQADKIVDAWWSRYGKPRDGQHEAAASLRKMVFDALDRKDARIRELTTLAEKVDAIRNTIVGAQNISFSRDIYPLVAALGDAGYPGEGYEKASARIHGYVEEIKKLDVDLAAAKARCERLAALLRQFGQCGFCYGEKVNYKGEPCRSCEATGLTPRVRAALADGKEEG